MIETGRDFQERITAPERRIYGRIIIDYTNPQEDQAIDIIVNETANVSWKDQIADSIKDTPYKWASLDGSCALDKNYHPAPGTQLSARHYQMGWWGKTFSGPDGKFPEPFPTVSLYFIKPHSIKELNVIGDICRKEWPKEFDICLQKKDGTVLHSESIIDNEEIQWEKQIIPVAEVSNLILTIKKWNLPGRQAKIIELFTAIREIYEGQDIYRISLFEERDISHGSLPIGNISSNEIEIMLNNIDHRFSPGNKQSPIYGYMKSNRRIQAWIGIDAYVEKKMEEEGAGE